MFGAFDTSWTIYNHMIAMMLDNWVELRFHSKDNRKSGETMSER